MNLKKEQFISDIFGNEYMVAKDSSESENKVLCFQFINNEADVLKPLLIDKNNLIKE